MKKVQVLSIIVLVGISTLLTITFVYWMFTKQSALRQLQQQEQVIPQQSRILAIAHLEPAGDILTIAGPVGERVAQLAVKEGNWVKSGQILAYLSNYAVQRSQRDLAASRVAELEQQLRADTATAQVQIQQSKAQIQQIDQPQQLQVKSQEAVLQGAKATLLSASKTRDRYQQLYKDGAISRQSFDDQELVVSQAQESVNEAQATLNQLRRSRISNLQKAQADLAYTKANLEQVKSHSILDSAQQELQLAASHLEQTLIRAPQAGKILKIFAHLGESLDQQGLLQMGDTTKMYAIAEIYETDIKLVKIGQIATIHSPVFNQKIQGKVIEIGQFVFKNNLVSDDPTARSDVRVVEVKIQLEQSQLVSALSHLQVDVEITVDGIGEEHHVP